MKHYIKSTILAFGAMALFAACSENSWNDGLDGFEVPTLGPTASNITYTLTDADYEKIASSVIYQNYAAANEQTEMLDRLKATHAFPSETEAAPYISMFLRDSTNVFFAMANGTAIKLTYNIATEVPENLIKLNEANAPVLTVTEDDYIAAWGSDDNYIAAYAPANPATRNIPSLLKASYPDAEEGQYVVVAYNEASTNPVFATVGGDEYELSDVLGDYDVGDYIEVKGYVTSVNKQGFILTDAAGSILCYQGKTFDPENVAIGDYVTTEGEVSVFNTGMQLPTTDDSYTIGGAGKYKYPYPIEYTGEMMDAAVKRSGNYAPIYVSFVAEAVISGNYLNFNVEGATASQGSGYQVPASIVSQITSGETYRVTGYFVSVSSGKYFNVSITNVEAVKKSAAKRAPAAAVPSVMKNALYKFDGTTWGVASDFTMLQPTDYTAMGLTYSNFSGSQPETYLPNYCRVKFPYAAAEDVVTVAYLYYSNGNVARAMQLMYNGSDWVIDPYKEVVTSQFVKNSQGFWNFDPSVVVTLAYVKNSEPAMTYYYACVNWVYENISVPMGATSITNAPFIYKNKANAEYYSGASAYYANVDVRAVTAKNNMPDGYTGYEGLTDDEISDLIKHRFCEETLPGALATLHPDMKPVEGVEVTFTVNFTAYEGVGIGVPRTVIYVVDAPAHFTLKSCTWFEEAVPEPEE